LPELEIVRASAQDIPFIMATERLPGNEGLVGRWEREEHERALADAGNAYFIGLVADRPVGFVIVQRWAPKSRGTLIRRIIVAETGKKVGRELLSNVIDTIFAETKAHWLWLNVHADNVRAQRCYSALGFYFAERAFTKDAGKSSNSLLMVLQRRDWRQPVATDPIALAQREVNKGVGLREIGRTEQAIVAFKSAAESGHAMGYIELANIAHSEGDENAEREWMLKAEALAAQPDERAGALSNLACSLACQIGVGQTDFDEAERKARAYLRKAAELGNLAAQVMLAQQLLFGLNGEAVNEAEYETWMTRAIEQGDEHALITHVKNRLHKERDVEPDLISKLEERASDSRRARQLLQLTDFVTRVRTRNSR